MKDTKVPIGWLIPVAVIIVAIIFLIGWFLGHSGWSVSELSVGGVKVVPPTATAEHTSTPLSTVTPIATSRPPTSIPFVVDWVQEIGQVPESGTQLSWKLSAGQTLFLSGGQFQLGNTFCGGDPRQICVLVYETTTDQTITINALIPRQNYIGITETLSPEDALKQKQDLFWIPPNCTSGCKRAVVLFFHDGSLINKSIITSP